MMAAGYKKDLAAGSVCAGGSLGTTIPPSVVIIIYASIVEMSVGDLFAGIMIPAFSMVAMFVIYILVRCWIQKDAGPGLRGDDLDIPLGQKLWMTCTSLLPALLPALRSALLSALLSALRSARLSALLSAQRPPR